MSAIGYFMNAPWYDKKEVLKSAACFTIGIPLFAAGAFSCFYDAVYNYPNPGPFVSEAVAIGGLCLALYGFGRGFD